MEWNAGHTRVQRFRRTTSGAAVVEFVIVFPLMLLMFGFIVEFGRVYWGYQAALAGVREASRYVARVVPEDICETAGSIGTYVSNTEIRARITGDASGTSMLPADFDVGLDGIVASYACKTGSYRISPWALATVSADVTMPVPLAGLFTLFGDWPATLEVTISDDARVFGQ